VVVAGYFFSQEQIPEWQQGRQLSTLSKIRSSFKNFSGSESRDEARRKICRMSLAWRLAQMTGKEVT
jgi:hypothetical protein